MTVLVRIAPSPTGLLHVGNIRTALVNWLFARKNNGKFMLRLDDTDQSRSRPEFAAAIEEDLGWLGLAWDSFARQSDRFAAYEAAHRKLIASGRLYPCYETPEELEIRRKMQSSRGLPPIYDRAALKLTEDQKTRFAQEGRRPHYRFLLNGQPISWDDVVRGPVRFESGHISDPVLIREDGIPLYTFASVVDDGEMNVTHIVRGEDHVSNTAVQVQIFEALGFPIPAFAHLALLKTKEGELSKRTGGSDIRALREQGFEPMAINSYLAKIGTSDPVEPFETLEQLAAHFSFTKFGRAPANYDAHELERLNEKLLTHMLYESAAPRLAALGLTQIDKPFWNAIHGNIKKLAEVKEWWDIVHTDSALSLRPPPQGGGYARFAGIADEMLTEPPLPLPLEGEGRGEGALDYLTLAASLLPPKPWDETTWPLWNDAIKKATNRKGRELFMPLRLALTGREHGPEMKQLILLLGREKVEQRLLNPAQK